MTESEPPRHCPPVLPGPALPVPAPSAELPRHCPPPLTDVPLSLHPCKKPPYPDSGARICAALATMRHGKTNLMKWTIRNTPFRRIVIVDPKREYDLYGDTVVADKLAGLVEAAESDLHLIIRGRLDDKEADLVWSALSGAAHDGAGLTDCLIVIDEAHNWMTANSCPTELQNLMRYMGHNRQQIWFATQLAADLWRGLRGMALEICAWRYYQPRDMAAVCDWLRIDQSDVDALGAHEYYRWRARDGAAPTIEKEKCDLIVDRR